MVTPTHQSDRTELNYDYESKARPANCRRGRGAQTKFQIQRLLRLWGRGKADTDICTSFPATTPLWHVTAAEKFERRNMIEYSNFDNFEWNLLSVVATLFSEERNQKTTLSLRNYFVIAYSSFHIKK